MSERRCAHGGDEIGHEASSIKLGRRSKTVQSPLGVGWESLPWKFRQRREGLAASYTRNAGIILTTVYRRYGKDSHATR